MNKSDLKKIIDLAPIVGKGTSYEALNGIAIKSNKAYATNNNSAAWVSLDSDIPNGFLPMDKIEFAKALHKTKEPSVSDFIQLCEEIPEKFPFGMNDFFPHAEVSICIDSKNLVDLCKSIKGKDSKVRIRINNSIVGIENDNGYGIISGVKE